MTDTNSQPDPSVEAIITPAKQDDQDVDNTLHHPAPGTEILDPDQQGGDHHGDGIEK